MSHAFPLAVDTGLLCVERPDLRKVLFRLVQIHDCAVSQFIIYAPTMENMSSVRTI